MDLANFSQKFGVHFDEDGQIALVSGDVSTNSQTILKKSDLYLEGTTNNILPLDLKLNVFNISFTQL